MSDSDSPTEIQDRVTISDKARIAATSTAAAAAAPLSSPPAVVKDIEHEKKKKELIERFAQYYEIDAKLASQMQILEDYDLVILCDDSGSMNTPIHGTTTNRWDECRQMVHVIVDVFSVFDSNGVDVYFLK